MKKRLMAAVVVVAMLIGVMAGCASTKKYDAMLGEMNLVWEDNFDTLDSSKWSQGFVPDEGKQSAVRKGGFWAYDAVSLANGNLQIRTDYRTDGEAGAGWYSGCLTTLPKGGSQAEGGKFLQKYGYFEARCKVPAIEGAWAAFWMMPYDRLGGDKDEANLNTGTDGTEIDIFESAFYYNTLMRNTVNHAIHYDGYNEHLKSVPKVGVKVGNLYDEYHTYGVEWSEKYYKFYIDGKLTWTVEDGSYKNAEGKKIKQNCVSQVEEFLLLSMEVVSPDGSGQTAGWCGDPSKNDKSKKYDFLVDYVRVYQYK